MKNLCRVSVAAAVAVAWVPHEARAEVSVTASIQPVSTTVGEPVQLSVTVNGSQKVSEVPAVNIEGAQSQHIGASTQFSVVNGSFSSAITHRYLITPLKPGELLIPSIQVTVEGKRYETPPLKLQVTNPGQAPAGEPEQPVPLAEVEWPKRTVFVGETFPVEARLLIPSGIRWNIDRMPEFLTDAFTKTPFQQPQTRQFVRDGREYQLVTFRTLMTAIKSGKVPLGPLTFTIQVAAPKKRNNNATSPFGGIFDGFPFDTQPTTLQERKVILPEQAVEVKDIPAEGKPSSFRGAIGKFRFSAVTTQSVVKAGEPLNVTMQVEGEGNFDRIEAPPMVKDDGWRIYPPESNFTKSDETGVRGVKTFTLAVVPEKSHTETPVFEFAAFDPETGTFQTQRNAATPLKVEGLKEPEPPKAVAAPPPKTAPKPPTAQEPTSGVEEVLTSPPPSSVFWTSSKSFWALQALLTAAFSGVLAAIVFRRVRAKNGLFKEAMQKARSLQQTLAAETSRTECFRLGVRTVQVLTAVKSGQPRAAVDALAATKVFGHAPGLADEIDWLFEADASLQFAGNSSSTPVSSEEKTRIQNLLSRMT